MVAIGIHIECQVIRSCVRTAERHQTSDTKGPSESKPINKQLGERTQNKTSDAWNRSPNVRLRFKTLRNGHTTAAYGDAGGKT